MSIFTTFYICVPQSEFAGLASDKASLSRDHAFVVETGQRIMTTVIDDLLVDGFLAKSAPGTEPKATHVEGCSATKDVEIAREKVNSGKYRVLVVHAVMGAIA